MCAVTQKGILHESEGTKQYQTGWQSIFSAEKMRMRNNRESNRQGPLSRQRLLKPYFPIILQESLDVDPMVLFQQDRHSPPNALTLSQALCPPYQFTRKRQLSPIPQQILWNPVNNQLQTLPLASLPCPA